MKKILVYAAKDAATGKIMGLDAENMPTLASFVRKSKKNDAGEERQYFRCDLVPVQRHVNGITVLSIARPEPYNMFERAQKLYFTAIIEAISKKQLVKITDEVYELPFQLDVKYFTHKTPTSYVEYRKDDKGVIKPVTVKMIVDGMTKEVVKEATTLKFPVFADEEGDYTDDAVAAAFAEAWSYVSGNTATKEIADTTAGESLEKE